MRSSRRPSARARSVTSSSCVFAIRIRPKERGRPERLQGTQRIPANRSAAVLRSADCHGTAGPRLRLHRDVVDRVPEPVLAQFRKMRSRWNAATTAGEQLQRSRYQRSPDLLVKRSYPMPGIVGLITKLPRKDAERQLQRMLEPLRHEPLYRTGTWIDESLGVYVGWSVLEGSFADGMPLANERGTSVLVFSGEEFPEPGTRSRGSRGADTGSTPADASTSCTCPKRTIGFPAGLNGRFHGLLADRARGTATLFNDRYGMHRVYYHHGERRLLFRRRSQGHPCRASEMPAGGSPRRWASSSRAAPSSRTGRCSRTSTCCRLVPRWVFSDGVLERKGRYFHPREWEEQEVLEPEAYERELRTVFSQNLPRYFEARQRVGMSLTGGLDTRMIMAWHKARPGIAALLHVRRHVPRLPGRGRGPPGRRRLRAAARSHRRRRRLSSPLPGLRRAHGVPHGRMRGRDARARPLRQREGARDRPGQDDGELRRGSPPPRPRLQAGPTRTRVVRSRAARVDVRQAAATYTDVAQGHPLSFAVFRQAPWHHYGLLALEQTQLSLRSPYLDNDFVRTVFRAPESAVDQQRRVPAVDRRGGRRTCWSIRTDRGGGGGLGHVASAVDPAVCASSSSRRSMPTTTACRSGWRRIDHASRAPASRAAVPGAAQVLPLPRVVPRCASPAYVRETAARPAHAVASVSRTAPARGDGARAHQRRAELHLRHPQGADAGAPAPLFPRSAIARSDLRFHYKGNDHRDQELRVGSATSCRACAVPAACRVRVGADNPLRGPQGLLVGTRVRHPSPRATSMATSCQDLALANAGDDTASVLLGNGDGTFQPPRSVYLGQGAGPQSVAIADFNRNGRPDLAVANTGSQRRRRAPRQWRRDVSGAARRWRPAPAPVP